MKTINVYQCSYCGATYLAENYCKTHEASCQRYKQRFPSLKKGAIVHCGMHIYMVTSEPFSKEGTAGVFYEVNKFDISIWQEDRTSNVPPVHENEIDEVLDGLFIKNAKNKCDELKSSVASSCPSADVSHRVTYDPMTGGVICNVNFYLKPDSKVKER